MLYKLKKDEDLYDEWIKSQLIKEQKAKLKPVDLESHKAKEVPQSNIMKDSTIDKEAQKKLNERYLLESYEEEENNVQSHNDFINSLGEEEIHNIENAMDALEIKDEETSDSKEARTELMDQGDCEHDWIRGRVRLPFKEIVGIRIPVKVKLTPTITYKILALVETGCTKNIIHNKYFARCPEIVHTIDQDKAEISTDMSGIKKLHNQDLSMINDDMILGLRFLQYSLQTTIIHEQGITFIPYQDNIPYITEVRKTISSNEGKAKIETQEYDDNNYVDNIDEELVCKLNIINPDYIIKTSPIEATPKDIEEFKMHIEELLKLGAIRESRSPHRSAAFIVRNHAEIARGKSRMEGKIYLQDHIAKKILEFPDVMNDKKTLQQFLGIVNYARNYIENLAKLAGPLYAKLRKNGQKHFNSEDIKLKGVSPTGIDCFCFGAENKLRIFPPNTYKFKPRDHIVLDEVQECILDNFWYQYNNKREDKGYMLAILNSLAEYFHTINGLIQPKESPENIEKKAIYVIYKGKNPGIYVSFEQVIAQKIEKDKDGGILWKKYTDIDQALTYARNILGVNYFLEPAAKEYIQKYKKIRELKPSPSGINIKEEGSSMEE
uniref:Reverse transcriptase/retrotransposon-derived protein RNase H-like domain-containing protein n=1 Tax=Setaria italica TaxID=4555 RepID=K4A1T1_SETIT